MTSIIRWDPLREVTGTREMMDRLFDESFARPFSTALADGYGAGLPALDVYQTENEIVVKAGLPGVKADEVQISVANGVLSFRGEVKEAKTSARAPTICASAATAASPARSACRPMSTLTKHTPSSMTAC